MIAYVELLHKELIDRGLFVFGVSGDGRLDFAPDATQADMDQAYAIRDAFNNTLIEFDTYTLPVSSEGAEVVATLLTSIPLPYKYKVWNDSAELIDEGDVNDVLLEFGAYEAGVYTVGLIKGTNSGLVDIEVTS